jgi:hypothetical protein
VGTLTEPLPQPITCGLRTGPPNPTYSCYFPLKAVGGAVTYTASVPGGQSDFSVDIIDPSDTLQAGQETRTDVNLVVTWFQEQNDSPFVTVNPGGLTVQFSLPPA